MFKTSLLIAATFMAMAVSGTPLPSAKLNPDNQTGQKPGCTKFKKLNLKAIVPILQKKLVKKAVKKQIKELDCANEQPVNKLEKQV